MKSQYLPKLHVWISCACLLAVTAIVSVAQDKSWRPVTAEELQMRTPKVEADADAEAMLWDVYVSDEQSGSELQTVLHHYLKIKIFNERGQEAFSKVDIPFGRIANIGFDVKVMDIAARTTRPDGTVVELKDKDVFEKDVVKGNGLKIKAKSFAVPGIVPGSVIEYRWKEIRGAVSFYQRLQLAREIPVQLVQYHIRALDQTEYGMNGQAFNADISKFIRKEGFWVTSAVNVPSFREEPNMPPEYSIRPWILLYYVRDQRPDPEKYWKDYGKKQFDLHKNLMKVSDDVRDAATKAVGTETDPQAKVKKIFDWVRANTKNVFDDVARISEDDLKNIKENKSPSDTLKRGQGTGHDINMLFAAMVNAAGLDARNVNLPRRSDIFFPKWFTDEYFMKTENIAVKIGDGWRFFDPASRYASFGMLNWDEEGQNALVGDPKEPVWTTTNMSPASASLEKRMGRFKLLPDGTLEGTAQIEWTGHLAAEKKEQSDDDTPQQREDDLKNTIRRYILGSAEVSDITIENVTDPDKPLTWTFKLRVPGFATRTGKRLFFQPNIFERSTQPTFESSNRRYEVYFDYPWAEKDDITIELPTGFDLENPEAPGTVADPNRIGVDDVSIALTQDKRTIVYTRDFSFGNGGKVRFPKESYGALKGLFEAFHKTNTAVLTLRQSGGTGVGQ